MEEKEEKTRGEARGEGEMKSGKGVRGGRWRGAGCRVREKGSCIRQGASADVKQRARIAK